MAKVVYLHIGAPKTGSSYLQNILSRNRQKLRKRGILYLGAFYASLDLRGARFQGYNDPKVPGAWARLVSSARDWSDTVVISHENLASAGPEHVERAVADLNFAELHIVYTARDLVRQIPAVWQEGVKNRSTLTFKEFIERLKLASDKELAERTGFWRSQDAVRVLEPWARHLGSERIHVVTVPPAGAPPRLLWERFAGVMGIEPDVYDTNTALTNSSLGSVEAALLRRLNRELRGNVQWPVYQKVVKRFLALEVLAQRSDPQKIALPADQREWVNVCSGELVDGLRAAGYHVSGDLEELIPRRSAGDDPLPADEVPVEQELEAAVDAIAGLVVRMGELQHSARQLRAELRETKSTLRRARTPHARRQSKGSDKRPATRPSSRRLEAAAWQLRRSSRKLRAWRSRK